LVNHPERDSQRGITRHPAVPGRSRRNRISDGPLPRFPSGYGDSASCGSITRRASTTCA